MSKLWLYAVFHLNLAFSSIPKSHFPLILDRCYWPLLEVSRRMGVPFGFEATGYTLEILENTDASFIQALKSAWCANEIEFVGASYTQSILPLCPAEANRQNLAIGNAIYTDLLGQQPRVAYVNEQTYSSGLVDLYLEAGYETIFMEWNNPARFHAYPPETRYQPKRALNPEGSQSVTVIWNDSIAFQKLQRVLNQSLTQEDYLAYLAGHHDPKHERGFPFYGSDAEIIDYHPGFLEAQYLESTGSQDIQRLVSLLEAIQSDTRYSWTTPSAYARKITGHGDPIRLESSEYPMPCKKQPKYNPTRWAVTGLEDIYLNTNCHRRFQEMEALASKGCSQDSALWRLLLQKWGSDFRTHTTEEKRFQLRQVAASLELQLEEAFSKYVINPSGDGLNLVLWNPNNDVYTGPLTVEVQFPNKMIHGYPQLQSHPSLQAFQIEGTGYYQDGSIRWVKAVLMVSLPAKAETLFCWESAEKPAVSSGTVSVTQTERDFSLQTEAVSLKLLLNRGGAIDSLRFNTLDNKPWVGTISHGAFEDISLGADFYSGHFILASKAGEKATDLQQGTLQIPGKPEDFPVRIPVEVGVTTEIGNLWKTLYIYRDLPRIDLLYHFRFKDLSAASCRVGVMTVLPGAFDRASLAYRTVNGGVQQERFPLQGHTVTHAEPVSVAVSAQHGLGATEGWVAIEDKENRVILRTYPQAAYAMPMIHYQESGEDYFLRILPSIGEFDDTSHQLWRGHHQVMFSWSGQKASQAVSMPMLPLSLSPQAKVLSV